ncbi:MAG: WecB/TagA/CpsF family glycosyltransferase [Thermonemataceae bacterium]
MTTKKVISLAISLTSYQEALQQIVHWGKLNKAAYACFANVHMTIEAYRQKLFASQVNQANYVFADGKPLVIALRLLYGVTQERIAGMDFMEDIFRQAHTQQLKIFLYGSTDDVLDAICKRARQQYPQVQIVGRISPPFRKLSEQEQQKYIDQINDTGAHLVLVALGCPKQEKWMARYSPQIRAVLLGVGGAFPVFAQMQKRAPNWMQKWALEWLYRFWQEPRRLWKRYFITNTYFLWLFFRQLLKR